MITLSILANMGVAGEIRITSGRKTFPVSDLQMFALFVNRYQQMGVTVDYFFKTEHENDPSADTLSIIQYGIAKQIERTELRNASKKKKH